MGLILHYRAATPVEDQLVNTPNKSERGDDYLPLEKTPVRQNHCISAVEPSASETKSF